MRLYRLTERRDPAKAFDGTRSAQHPGRWNVAGRAAVYASTSLSLALLEVLVRGARELAEDYAFYRVDVADALLERLDRSNLSDDWRSMSGREGCRALAEAWRAGGTAVGLIVPSAVVPEAYEEGEFNVVFDPRHASFGQIVIGPSSVLVPDGRFAG